MKNNQTVLEELQTRVDEGLPVEQAVVYLHDEGLSALETIKLIMEKYGLTLGESKSIVTRSPSWEKATAAADRLHEDLLNTPSRRSKGRRRSMTTHRKAAD